jgi:hypothetical protein
MENNMKIVFESDETLPNFLGIKSKPKEEVRTNFDSPDDMKEYLDKIVGEESTLNRWFFSMNHRARDFFMAIKWKI